MLSSSHLRSFSQQMLRIFAREKKKKKEKKKRFINLQNSCRLVSNGESICRSCTSRPERSHDAARPILRLVQHGAQT